MLAIIAPGQGAQTPGMLTPWLADSESAQSLTRWSEIIGKDLLDAMARISGKDGIGGATTAMEGFATEVGNVITGISVLIAKLKSLPGAGFIKQFIEVGTKTSAIGYLSRLGASEKARSAGTPAQSPGERAAIDKANKEALRLQKIQNNLKTIDNNATERKIKLTGDQQALEELKKKFDLDRIQINAALNGNIDKETELRLKSLMAIHDNDAALAGKIKAEIEAGKQVSDFGNAARAAAELLRTSYSAGLSSFKQSEFDSLAASANAGITAPTTSGTSMPSPLDYGTFGAGTFRAAEAATTNIQVNVAGSITTERDLVSAITQGIYNNQAAGIPISYTTAFR